MVKANKLSKVLISLLAVLFCSVFFCGCAIQGIIDKNVLVTVGSALSKAEGYKTTAITITLSTTSQKSANLNDDSGNPSPPTEDTNENTGSSSTSDSYKTYKISFSGLVKNNSDKNEDDRNYFAVKFAVYDGDKKFIANVECSIGALKHGVEKEFTIEKAIKTKNTYKTTDAYAILTYAA
ncbi:MAG: hypothetical protein ACI4TT_02060 [Christensenellales bacterium]